MEYLSNIFILSNQQIKHNILFISIDSCKIYICTKIYDKHVVYVKTTESQTQQ